MLASMTSVTAVELLNQRCAGYEELTRDGSEARVTFRTAMKWRTGRLHHVRDSTQGIRRFRTSGGFHYQHPRGRTVQDARTLERIRALAIPPAWENVWICPDEFGHLQATGRDARGRKQYRYHPRFRAHRDQDKFGRLVSFAEHLPRLRRAVEQDLARPDLDRAKVLAIVTRLLDTSYIRIGNRSYALENGSYGLTTLRNKHVQVARGRLKLCFPGKSGVTHEIGISDPRLVRAVKRCRDLPGYELFQYIDTDGNRHPVDSEMVNGYIRDAMGEEFTAKDFRTWQGTVEMAIVLSSMNPFKTEHERKQLVSEAITEVAVRLGNRPATCRKYYIHPTVIEAFEKNQLPEGLKRPAKAYPAEKLNSAEHRVLKLLKG